MELIGDPAVDIVPEVLAGVLYPVPGICGPGVGVIELIGYPAVDIVPEVLALFHYPVQGIRGPGVGVVELIGYPAVDSAPEVSQIFQPGIDDIEGFFEIVTEGGDIRSQGIKEAGDPAEEGCYGTSDYGYLSGGIREVGKDASDAGETTACPTDDGNDSADQGFYHRATTPQSFLIPSIREAFSVRTWSTFSLLKSGSGISTVKMVPDWDVALTRYIFWTVPDLEMVVRSETSSTL